MLIIDGYNWAFSDAWDGDDADEIPLERLRGQVTAKLNHWIEQRGERVICVFDGADRFNRERAGKVEVWFADGTKSADDEIVHAVRGVPRPREARVVTDDRGLARRVKDEGGVVWSLGELTRALRELFRAPELSAEERENIPGAAALIRAIRDVSDGRIALFRVIATSTAGCRRSKRRRHAMSDPAPPCG